MPSYPFNKQAKIVIATMTLHNYIIRHAQHDKHFEKEENEHNDYTNEEIELKSMMDKKVKKKHILTTEPKHEKWKF